VFDFGPAVDELAAAWRESMEALAPALDRLAAASQG
jgi:hypothetical protein